MIGNYPLKIVNSNVIKNNLEDVDRTIYLLLQYKKNLMVSITASFQFYGNNLTITAPEGLLQVQNIIRQKEAELRITKFKEQETKIEKIEEFNSYKAMINHFYDCIIHKKELFVTK